MYGGGWSLIPREEDLLLILTGGTMFKRWLWCLVLLVPMWGARQPDVTGPAQAGQCQACVPVTGTPVRRE